MHGHATISRMQRVGGAARVLRPLARSDDVHPDLPDEQARLDHAYHCLATMQATAEHLADGLTVAPRSDMDAAANRAALLRYRAALDVGGTLCFGRIDADEGDQWYIGRRHLEDEG